jgi:multimeric flavodoxin WrbA
MKGVFSMKVVLVNGSPHPRGCTYTALVEIATVLEAQGVETEIFQVGVKPVSGCIACERCRETGRCFMNDKVNEFLDKAAVADAFVFGSAVHFAAISGAMASFLDRVFFAGTPNFRGKPGTGIVSCRRGGTTAAFDQLNKYLAYSEMPIVSSQYWNMVHGNTPEEVKQDLEGLQIMRTLGSNMAWLLKCLEAGKAAGIEMPEKEKRQRTNFIR